MIAQQLYSNQRYLWLCILVIIMVGLASLRSLGRQEDPTITNYVANVTTFFPGAEPSRVEALVTRPLEEELRSIPEVDEVRSTSSSGVSSITVELYDTLSKVDIERSWSEVRDAVTDASLRFPSGTLSPVFDNDRTSAYARIVAISAANGYELSRPLLSRVADDLAEKTRNFPGTKLVEVFGEADEEIRVELNESALFSRGLSINEVSRALRAADPRIASGRAAGEVNDLLIEIAGELDSPARVSSVIIRVDSRGNAVTVGDIATVYRTQRTPAAALAMVEGKPGILLGIAMNEGLQVDKWSADFAAFLEEYRVQAPQGVSIVTSYDQAIYTEERLRGVLLNLAAGVVIVLLVLLFTLGLRAAAVVAVILPLCTLLSLFLMYQIGLPIHQMSVTGLVVALGLLVDGSIVMTDEVRKRLVDGDTPLDAISRSVKRMRVPLLSSTLTTVLTFVPMVILPGPAGDFLGSNAKAVVIMLGSSLVLALVITPVLAARLLPSGLQRESHWWETGVPSGAMGHWLTASLDWSIANPLASVLLALSLPLAGFMSFGTLTAQFFPGTDRDQVTIKVTLPPGRSINDSYHLVEQLDARLRQEDLIRRIDWTVGESAPPFYYNIVRTREGIPNYAQALILTKDENQTDDLIRRLQNELDEEFPQARIVVLGIDQGPPVAAPLEIEVYGEDLETLRRLGEAFRLRMERVGNITHTTTSLLAGAPKVVFELDEVRVRRAGMDLSGVADALDAALRGRTGGEVLEGTQRLPVRARLAEADWGDPEQIANIRLPLPAPGQNPSLPQSISISTLGDFVLKPANSSVTRTNGSRVNIVQGFVTRGVLAEEALKELQRILEADPVAIPLGYRYQFGGTSDARASVVDKIIAPFGLVMAALVATIVLTFNSWRLSLVAFSIFIISLGLSVLSLAVFRYPFGVQALIGVIGSIGVSINAAIIILTALQIDPHASRGDALAVRQVVMDSSRHIVSTTITTFGGFLPLILEGSQFWPPFAMAIAGGVLLSTVVSFYYVPPMFMLVYKRRHRRLRDRQSGGGDVNQARALSTTPT
ncbi:MAG: efflux RND transporter permease subunit [Congregibacter sp.]